MTEENKTTATEKPAKAKKIKTPLPEGLREVPFEAIIADDEFNARNGGEGIDPDAKDIKELAASIKENGLLQPLGIRVVAAKSLTENQRAILGLEEGDEAPLPWYALLTFGFRRYYAITGLRSENPKAFKTVDVTQKLGDGTDDFFRNMAENIERKNLNPGEMADAFYKAKENLGLSAEDIAGRLGGAITKGYVSNLISLRKGLQGKAWKAFKNGEIGFDLARMIKSAGEVKEQEAALTAALKATEGQEGKKRKRGAKDAAKQSAKGGEDTAPKATRPSVTDQKGKLGEVLELAKPSAYQLGIAAALKWTTGDKKRLPMEQK